MIFDKFVQLLIYSVTTVTWKFVNESSRRVIVLAVHRESHTLRQPQRDTETDVGTLNVCVSTHQTLPSPLSLRAQVCSAVASNRNRNVFTSKLLYYWFNKTTQYTHTLARPTRRWYRRGSEEVCMKKVRKIQITMYSYFGGLFAPQLLLPGCNTQSAAECTSIHGPSWRFGPSSCFHPVPNTSESSSAMPVYCQPISSCRRSWTSDTPSRAICLAIPFPARQRCRGGWESPHQCRKDFHT